jgi:hypothetical protein
MIEWIILALIGAAAMVCLTWSMINNWFSANKTPDAQYGELIRKRLETGRYQVIAGVFSSGKVRLATQKWEADSLDAEVEAHFAGRNNIMVTL